MSKLRTVREWLETNPEVIIAKVLENNYLPGRKNCFSHTVDFWVAPKNGLYTAEELQGFMMGLVPDGLQPTHKNDFRQYWEDGDLNFGRLYFN